MTPRPKLDKFEGMNNGKFDKDKMDELLKEILR